MKNGAGKVKTPFLIKPPLLQLFVAGVDLYFGCIMHIALTIFTHYYATYYGGFEIKKSINRLYSDMWCGLDLYIRCVKDEKVVKIISIMVILLEKNGKRTNFLQ